MKAPSCIRKAIHNERGMALIIVLLVLTVLSVLGMALLGLSLNNTKMSNYEQKYEAVYYIAEAGAADTLMKIEKIALPLHHSFYGQENVTEDDFFKELERKILISYDSPQFENTYGETKADIHVMKMRDGQYKVRSTGIIVQQKSTDEETNNQTIERTVEQEINIHWGGQSGGGTVPGDGIVTRPDIPSNTAVFASSTIDLNGGAEINGNVGTSESAQSVTLSGGAKINGQIIALHEANLTMPLFPAYPEYSLAQNTQTVKNGQSYDVIQNGDLRIDDWRSDGYTLQLTENVSFKEIILKSNNTLIIDTGLADKAIVVDHLNVTNGHIYVTGSGKLTIYIRDEITLGSGSTINQNTMQFEKLNVFLLGAQEVKLSGSQKIYGSLYAKNADIQISGGGGFQGHIFTGGSHVKISGGSRVDSTLIYAPNADTDLAGGGQVNGMIATKTFTGSGGTVVNVGEVNFAELPFPFGNSGSLPPAPPDDEIFDPNPVREN